MQKTIHLKFLQRFACLASDCPDDCCHGWNIHLDADTLKKWQGLADEEARSRLLAPVIHINDGGTPAEVIRRREDGTCPNLDEQGLCVIQRDHGHDFLPQTCQAYPRVQVENKTTVLESMHLSCPAVAAMLVKEEDSGLLFSSAQEDIVTGVEKTQGIDIDVLGQFYNRTTQLVMTASQWPLDMRLYFLADMLAKTAKQAAVERLDSRALRKLCPASEQGINKRLKDIAKQKNSKRLKFNKLLSGRFWYFVLAGSDVFKTSMGENTGFEDMPLVQHMCMAQTLSEGEMDKYFLRLNHLQSDLLNVDAKSDRQRLQGMLENYLTVKFMNHGFPWYPFQNHFILTFLDCVVPFFLVRTLISLHLSRYGAISDDEISTIIYKVEKKLAHNLSIFEGLKNEPELLDLDEYAASWTG